MRLCHGVREILQNYVTALAAKDLDAIGQMMSARSLIENPFVKPNRLLGKTEILKAHVEFFSCLEKIEIHLANTESNDHHAIGEGRLEITRPGEDKQSLQVGIVAEAVAGELARISLYCDARNIRLWSDKTIL